MWVYLPSSFFIAAVKEILVDKICYSNHIHDFVVTMVIFVKWGLKFVDIWVRKWSWVGFEGLQREGYRREGITTCECTSHLFHIKTLK